MATIKLRGNSHTVIYSYKGDDGKNVQQWETYQSEIQAVQRKAVIDLLQRNKDYETIKQLAFEYRQERDSLTAEPKRNDSDDTELRYHKKEDNMKKTFSEFADIWVPIHARRQRYEPGSYDCLVRNMEIHILPYFGERVMSTITSEDVDKFLDYLSKKKCRGSKSFNKDPEDIPTLSSATIKKIYNALYSAFPVAKEWGYISEIPMSKAPRVKSKKRGFWLKPQIQHALDLIDNRILHLAVHLTFICSLRAGETMGIEIESIDFDEKSVLIKQTLQRVTDEALSVTPKDDIIRIYPKLIEKSKSQLVLKGPKTEDGIAKLYLTKTLMDEVRQRVIQIEKNKAFFGEEYHDYGLLLCHPDGNPIETRLVDRWFKNWQKSNNIDPLIDMQSLRKSGQMYKLRLTDYDLPLVAKGAGRHSIPVLLNHYDEVLEVEKMNLALAMQDDFYSNQVPDLEQSENILIEKMLATAMKNPRLAEQMAKKLQKMRSVQTLQHVRS